MSRNLTAQFLLTANSCFVAIDKIQPVAALLSADGVLLDVVSWAACTRPPEEWVWPNRRVAVRANCVFVQDLPDGLPVSLHIGVDSFEGVELVERADVAWRHPRLFVAVPKSSDGWTFDGQRVNDRWVSRVEYDGQAWDAGDGSIVARATSSARALVSIRRAPIRPWRFRPYHDLIALRAEFNELVSKRVPPVDIDVHCWAQLSDGRQAFDDYLPWSENLVKVVENHGGTNVRIANDGQSVDIYFFRNGKEYLVHDEPLDELGRPVGLRFWGTGIDDWSALPSSLIAG